MFEKKPAYVVPTQDKMKDRFGKLSGDMDKFVKTGILPFDLLTEGRGFPCGNFVNLFSMSKFGKSTCLLDACRNMILSDPVYNAVEYLDVEGTSDVIAKSMGLLEDDRKFLYLRPSFYEDLQLATDAWFHATDPVYRILCIDTMSAVSPDLEAIRAQGITKASIGLDARIRTPYLKFWHNKVKESDKTLIYISQVRANMDNNSWNSSPDAKYKAEGGYASEFFADLQIKFVGNSKLTSDDLNSDGSKGSIGKKGWMVAEKNKYSIPGVRIPFTLIYGVGVSNVLFLRDYLSWRGLIVTKGATYLCTNPSTGEESSVRGKSSMIEWIKSLYSILKDDFYANAKGYFTYLHLATKSSAGSDSGDED